jgi:ribose transport system substrate-binding protein
MTLAVSLTACSNDEPTGSPSTDATTSTTKQIKIGMASYTLGGPYFVGMEKRVVAAGAAAGVQVITSNADGNDEKLQSDIDNLIAQGVDGIIISGGPLNDFPGGLAAAKAAGIPVVLVDRLFSTPDFAAWIGPDNIALGQQDGKYIVDNLPDGGKAIIIKGGPADNTIGIDRTQGVKNALTAAGNFTIVDAPDFGNWSPDGGVTAMENMLAQHSDIKVVFCENDAMCLGALQACETAGRADGIIFAGGDGQNEAVAEILKDGPYKITGYNDAIISGQQ